MPVLSPHRSSSSGLSGSYRSTYSSPLDRSYYGGYNNPRVYSERFTTRSYTDADGRRVYSRSGSITEDGVTTRFREESREDSLSRDSGISSIREGSLYDYPTRRDNSSSRSDRLSTSGVIESVAELRNKYSPANYVPAIYRNKYENISRSKSINDIGLPPIESKSTSPSSGLSRKKQVTPDDAGNSAASSANSNNANCSSNSANNSKHGGATNANNSRSLADLPDMDANGNRRASVADLCRRFDDRPPRTAPAKVVGGRQIRRDDEATAKIQRERENSSKLEANGDQEKDEKVNGEEKKKSSRVNQCASFIPNEPPNDELESENEKIGRKYSYDVSTSTSTGGGGKGGGRGVAALAGTSFRRSLVIPPTDGDDDDLPQTRLGSSSDTKSGQGLVGLRNIGNTCFMNSVMQCLSNTRVLLDYIRKDGYQKDINTSTSAMKGALIKAFAEVIKELWAYDSSGPVNTAALKSQIQRFAPRFMGYSQQDAQEFLRYLLEGLHEEVNRVTIKPKPITTDIDDNLPDSEKAAEAWRRYLRSEDSFIVDAFVGQLKSTLKCTHCGHCSVTFDPFWDLSLPLPSGRNAGPLRLSHCLESFTKEETLDGDEKPKCAKCNERRRCTKSFTIQKFPQVLVIHLKRFSPMERFRGKLNTLVEFPLEGLDLTPYAAETQSGPSPRYNLYAVSEHSGTPYSGHYTAHCKNPIDGRWHEYNDSRVSSASGRSAISPEAYVLFYEREGGGIQRSCL
ncbi:ubiquitin carboxyl-terminal hydrolase Usp2-like isoform X2 [Euwallacea similis]|uniref:ubiquitin carboxyl-terminal hydrolase Usp2-like isoform X2 n=1 Tax=Euwallacea similis TaxID=1736056 RepID=UPI003450CE2C